MSICRQVLTALVFVAALPTLVHADGLRLYVSGNPVKQLPTVEVYYEPSISGSLSLEWTANGQPMSSNLTGIADCVYHSAQQYDCSALKNWFWDQPRYGRQPVRSEYPQAFYLPERDFDTQYCFRIRIDDNDWPPFVCARTPPAPGAPNTPPQPQVTKFGPTNGKGQVGGPTPFRLLVEWDRKADEDLVANYGIELLKGTVWVAAGDVIEPGQQTYETNVDMPSEAKVDDSYAVRVCARNIARKACSTAARTPGVGWDEQRVKSPGKEFQPKFGDAKVVAVEKSDERNKAILGALGTGSATPPPIDQNALAAKGVDIANADPISIELRKRQLNAAARRGFDIGMAAAEGNTAPGPGKQRIHDALSPAEQVGFDAALAFSLERNSNAEFAATGAAIAQQDPVTAEARDSVSDPMYWLGFDIATGIFGDPALGAKGNTATGPGSLKIRDALNASAQAGFNAAVAFHLARVYPR